MEESEIIFKQTKFRKLFEKRDLEKLFSKLEKKRCKSAKGLEDFTFSSWKI